MTVRISIVASICALVALAAFAPATAKPAAACVLIQVDLDTAAEEAEIVIVGLVVAKRIRDPDLSSNGVTVRVAAALKGDPGPEIMLPEWDDQGLDCPSGPPPMAVGERVLLFLSPFNGSLHVYGHGYGKYVLENREARGVYDTPPLRVDEALRRVADITGAPEQLRAALRFARGGYLPDLQPDAAPLPTDAPQPDAAPLPVEVEEDGGQSALLIALASALLASLVAALAGLGLRRTR